MHNMIFIWLLFTLDVGFATVAPMWWAAIQLRLHHPRIVNLKEAYSRCLNCSPRVFHFFTVSCLDAIWRLKELVTRSSTLTIEGSKHFWIEVLLKLRISIMQTLDTLYFMPLVQGKPRNDEVSKSQLIGSAFSVLRHVSQRLHTCGVLGLGFVGKWCQWLGTSLKSSLGTNWRWFHLYCYWWNRSFQRHLCTRLGWPGLGTVGQPVPESRSFLDALLQGGGGLDGEKAIEMAKAPQSLIPHFVNGYRRSRKESLPVIEEEMDADQDWWLRKGQGSLLAKRRWKYDRRPVFCNAERRQGFGRQQPLGNMNVASQLKDTASQRRRNSKGNHQVCGMPCGLLQILCNHFKLRHVNEPCS